MSFYIGAVGSPESVAKELVAQAAKADDGAVEVAKLLSVYLANHKPNAHNNGVAVEAAGHRDCYGGISLTVSVKTCRFV